MTNNQWNCQALEDWTARIFEACSMPAEQAAEAAAILVRSELRGYKTHGMTRVASYTERLRAGDFNPRPNLRHRSFPGGIVLDADGAMGQLAGPYAVRLGLEALATSASVLIAVQSSGHLGALGIHALLGAEAGAFSMIGQRTPPILAMEGFRHAAIGHNPIAFGCPVPGQAPLVFDIACSVAARGHILLAAREGKPIPEGWALDASGTLTTDADRALGGSLLPMGGHKGIGIAMMVECLAGALTATADSLGTARDDVQKAGAAGRQGGFLWMVKPGAFATQGVFDEYMSQWTGTYLNSGGDDARLPGHRGDAMERERRQRGVMLPPEIAQELRALGEQFGISFPASTTQPTDTRRDQ
ncbi:Ldh family oxidoreductase [Paraburkholderia sp. 40]|uniref:Ldh family oxidoreductase n=1 Tax=Paraburkholderia sp. 40 TaxID=2991059 RepID=UPI003D1B11B7